MQFPLDIVDVVQIQCMETNFLIKNILESLLKSFYDFILFNMNLLMQQSLPSSIQNQSTTIPQPPLPPPTNVVKPHLEVPAPMVLASKVEIPIDHVIMPSSSPPPIPQPLSIEG